MTGRSRRCEEEGTALRPEEPSSSSKSPRTTTFNLEPEIIPRPPAIGRTSDASEFERLEPTEDQLKEIRERSRRKVRRLVAAVGVSLTILCVVLVVVSLSFGPKFEELGVKVTAKNCSVIQESLCDQYYPATYLANFAKVDVSIPYFEDYALRALEFKQICASYDSYAKCNAENGIDSVGGCSSTKSGQRLFYAYLCEMLAPLVTDETTHPCWNATATSCKLSNGATTDEGRHSLCNFLESVELQINCALTDETRCSAISQDLLRRTRSETSSFLADYRCLENVEENLALDKEVDVIMDSQRETKLKTALDYCSSTQNREALQCLSNLWGIDEYLKRLDNRTLSSLLLTNETALLNVCDESAAYERCMTKLSGRGSCRFKSSFHAFASLLKIICAKETASVIQNHAPCLSEAKFDCIKTLDDIETHLVRVRNENNHSAMCEIYTIIVDGLTCLSTQSQKGCNSQKATDDIYSLISHVHSEGELNGCSTAGKENYEVDKTKTIQSEVSTVTKETVTNTIVSAGTNETTTSISETETEPSPQSSSVVTIDGNLEGITSSNPCIALDSQLCKNGNSQYYGFNAVSLVDNKNSLDSVCRVHKQIQHCSQFFACQSNLFYNGLPAAFALACGFEYGNFSHYIGCLSEIGGSPSMKTCVNSFQSDSGSLTSCDKTNTLLSCSYPRIFEKCGKSVADFHLNFLYSLAVNSNNSCMVPHPPENIEENNNNNNNNNNESPTSANNETILAQTVNCTKEESGVVEECVKPFKVVTDKIEALTSGGMSALIKGLNNMTQMFREGCSLRTPFETCITNGIKKGSQCKIVSCLLKIGETECKESADSRSIETKIRCMFSLVAEPIFKQCIQLVPKDSFSNFSKLRLYLPSLIQCLKEPILTKCGPESWRLVQTLSSSANPENIDLTCVINFDSNNNATTNVEKGESSNNILGEKVIESASNLTVQVKASKNETLLQNIDKYNETIFATTKVFCTSEELNRQDDCVGLLSIYKPIPVSMFDQSGKIDKACPLYNKFKMCLKQYTCFYPLGEAYKVLLEELCTSYYNAYKEQEKCLRDIVTFNRKIQTCIGSFGTIDLKTPAENLSEKGCKATGDLLKCIGDTVDDRCGNKALDFLYEIYNPFSQQFSSRCEHSRRDIGTPMQQCNLEQRNAYFECRRNVTFNPISIVSKMEQFPALCDSYTTDFQQCINSLSCIPEPANQAFNDTLARICFSPSKTADFDLHGECLTQVAASTNAQDCLKAYREIVFDDPGKTVCRKLNSVMECAVPLIADKCPKALTYIYDVVSYFAVKYRAGCVLNVPQMSSTNGPSQTNITFPGVLSDPKNTTPSSKTPSMLLSTTLRITFSSLLLPLVIWRYT